MIRDKQLLRMIKVRFSTSSYMAIVGMPQPPGHAVPAGVDPSAPGSVLAWTQSFGTAFSAVLQNSNKNVAQRLVRAGYVDLYSLTLGTEDFMNLDADQDEEVEDEQLLPSEARFEASRMDIGSPWGVS